MLDDNLELIFNCSYMDTGLSQEDLSEAMDDRDELWERVREIRASSTTWL